MNDAKIKYELLIIGGSAGSLDVIFPVISAIRTLRLPIILVLHRKEDHDNLLVALLAGKTKQQVKEAEDKELLLPGIIYIVPPDYHLLFENDGSLSLDGSERVNYSRPSIDVCFESAADVYGETLAALLLSGANEDGAAGMQKIKKLGGLLIVQEPQTASMPYMPQQAIKIAAPQHIVSADDLPAFIENLVSGR